MSYQESSTGKSARVKMFSDLFAIFKDTSFFYLFIFKAVHLNVKSVEKCENRIMS